MKRLLLCVGAAAAALVVASSAFAQGGVNFNWQTCYGDGPVTSNRAFACASNSGSNVMVVSYLPPHDISQVSGTEVVIDLISQSAPLPQWWQLFTAGSCRQTSLTMNVSYTGAGGCADYWLGGGGGGIAGYNHQPPAGGWSISPSDTSQHARIIIAWAVPASAIGPVTGLTEYFNMNISINNAKTVNSACTGCSDPVCLMLSSVKLTTPTPLSGTDVTIGNANSAGSNTLTWQGVGANCAAVPVRNATWGAVKALYR